MTLGERQAIFTQNLAKLLIWAGEQTGYRVRLDEVKRTNTQQRLYYQGIRITGTGTNSSGMLSIKMEQSPAYVKSRKMKSKHLDRLAADIILDIDGEYQTESKAYTKLGEYWKSLHPDNRWGGDWKGFPDGGHFQMGG